MSLDKTSDPSHSSVISLEASGRFVNCAVLMLLVFSYYLLYSIVTYNYMLACFWIWKGVGGM